MWWIEVIMINKNRTSNQVKQAISVAVLGTLVMGISACSLPQKSYPPMNGRFPIEIAESVERLELYARPDGMVLSSRDQQAVAEFVGNYAAHGDGPIYVNMPDRADIQQGAHQAQSVIAQNLAMFGLSGGQMKSGSYPSGNGPSPVIVSYRRLKALPRDCRQLGDITATYNNQPYDTYGCAYQSNLAAMISDPRQLLEPYPMTSPDTARRITVYDKYLAGENPASEQPERQEISAENR